MSLWLAYKHSKTSSINLVVNVMFLHFFYYILLSKAILSRNRDVENFKIHHSNLRVQITSIFYTLIFTLFLLSYSDIYRKTGRSKVALGSS